jgi:hypothetical protein
VQQQCRRSGCASSHHAGAVFHDLDGCCLNRCCVILWISGVDWESVTARRYTIGVAGYTPIWHCNLLWCILVNSLLSCTLGVQTAASIWRDSVWFTCMA